MAQRHARFDPDEELSAVLTRLWEMDDNKCHPGQDYQIDLQGYVKDRHTVREDRARNTLFEWVDDEVFKRKTYEAFIALLDNYESELGKAEVVTREEVKENRLFIDAICNTDVMRAAHKYLSDRGKAPADVPGFKRLLYDLWFKLYRRTRGVRSYDSSGFEHVFVGEVRKEEVVGLHNWIQFYLQEKLGNINYHGFFKRETLRGDEVMRLMSLQFTWKGGPQGEERDKARNSLFIGSSPEFEVAAYTLCYLLGKTDTYDIQLGEYETQIVLHKLGQGIGTAYIRGAYMGH